jgi:hypothetical protein
MSEIAGGFMLGFAFYHLLLYYNHVMVRECCREHYRLHPECPCGSCSWDRKQEGKP